MDAVINSYFVEPAIGPDGTLFFLGRDYLSQVDQSGVLRILAGCVSVPAPVNCVNEGGQRATLTQLFSARALDFGPDGRPYVLDNIARRIDQPMPALALSDVLIASDDGSQLYVFNADGRHLRTIDALLGHTVSAFEYDAAGLLSTITDADGNVVRVERDGTGSPTAIVAPFGQRTELTLGAGRYLATVKRPGELATTLSYTADGLLQTFADGNSNLHRFTYDDNGLLIRDDNAAGGFKTLVRTVTDSSSGVTVATALGNSITHNTVTLSTGAKRRTAIDGSGLTTTSVSEPNGTGTLTAPDGTITTVSIGSDPRFGLQAPVALTTTTVTPSGVQSTVTHSRTISLQDKLDVSSIISQIDSTIVDGHVYTRTFVKQDRSIVVRTPSGRMSAAYFDERGHLIRTESSGLAATTYSYDPRGRLLVASRGGREIRYTYDELGRLAQLTAPLSDSINYAYDAAGRVVSARYADGREALFNYDNNGNLTSVVPPGRGGHTFTYTLADLTAAYLPPSIGGDSGVVRYSYDNDQRLILASRSDGTATTFGYDPGGRLTSVLTPGSGRSIGYDQTGSVAVLTNATNAAVLSYGYDGALPVSTTLSGPVQGSITVAYDAEGRIGTVAVNGNNAVDNHYDGDGLLIGVGALSISRNAQTGIPAAATVDGVARTWTVDSLSSLSRTDAKFGTTELFAAAYGRDSLDRISELTETVQGTTRTLSYTYNSVGRLVEAREGGLLVTSYDYDSNGNRIRETGPTGSITSTYDGQDRLLSHGSEIYRYSANGELQLKIVGSDSTKYEYDAAGTLLRVVLPSGTSVEYVLDATGRRVGRKINGVLVQGFLYYDKLAPAAELDGQNNIVSRFVYGMSRTVPTYMVKNGVTYALISDHLGSVRLVVNASTGTVAQRLDYDSWGSVTQNTNPGFQPFGFAGGLTDQATGLVRFGARDYYPEIGRWTTKDPVGVAAGDPNTYAYVAGDPINNIDPSGLDLTSALRSFLTGVVGGAIGAYAIGAAVTIATVAASPAIAAAAAVFAIGATAYGGFQMGKALYEISSGTDWSTGLALPCGGRLDRAAGLLGAVVGGGLVGEGFAGGKEFEGDGWRVAPFGNRTGNPAGEVPHYHRAVPDPESPGNSVPGQGIGRHRPGQSSPLDNSFWDRF
jgi:RHS repeat-associated protein